MGPIIPTHFYFTANQTKVMKPLFLRVIGLALVAAGIAGLVFSVAGMVLVLQVEKQLDVSLTRGLDVVDQALVTTADGLAVANDSLLKTEQTLTSLSATMDGVAQTLDQAVPTVGALGGLMSRELPDTVTTAQESLSAASQSARLVDTFLSTISALPFLSLGSYDPDVPLHESLMKVADSLTDVPETLSQAGAGLEGTADALGGVQSGFSGMATGIGDIGSNLGQAQTVVTEYQSLISNLQGELARARSTLSLWLRLARWGVWILLIWLGIVQFALITQGLEVYGRGRAAARVPAEAHGSGTPLNAEAG